MIRYAYINNHILNLYSMLPVIKFPIEPVEIINLISNCRFMSYQKFAEINNCSIDDIIQICESKSGCSHYDIINDRYLILCNQLTDNNNNVGRQRWTCGHEIGHVICNHHTISAYEKLSENSLLQNNNSKYEAEADYFAATLLSPFPLFKVLHITSAMDIQKTFGLSKEASLNRYEQYLRWLNTRVKTAWGNDLIRIFNNQNTFTS